MMTELSRKSVVFGQGEEPGRTEVIGNGLTQGGPSSPILFSIVMDTFILLVKDALITVQRDVRPVDSSPILEFANDVVL